jgi:hypothetical protein
MPAEIARAVYLTSPPSFTHRCRKDTIIQLAGEPLHQEYQRTTAAGTKPNLAKLTLARKIAAIALSMWKSQKEYDSTKHRKQNSELVSRVEPLAPKG